ncbi:MAG: hypothetical protein JSU73_06325, partial [candidate division WOR-3 bacterium]
MRPTVLWFCVLAFATAALAQLPDTLWLKKLGGTGNDFGYSVAEAADEGFVVAGHTSSFGISDGDAYLVKLSPRGDTIWQSTFGGPGHQQVNRIRLCDDGGFVLAGWTRPVSPRNFWTARVDEFGDSLWANTISGHNNDHANDIIQLPSGDFITVGSTHTFGAGGGDFYVVRLSPEGDTVWTRTWGEDEPEEALAVTPTADGCLAVAGWSRTETGPWRPTLVKFTLDGDTAWSRKYYVEGDGGFYDILDLGSDSG